MHVLAPLARRARDVVPVSWIIGRVKIAITAWQSESGWYGDSVCRQAEQAEAMGFHSYWLPVIEENLLLRSHQWLAEMGEATG